jgi:hypothetical protein
MKNIIFTLERNSEWVPQEFYPIPASKGIPTWYKNMETSNGGDDKQIRESETIKRCMPILDSLTSGYLIKTFSDLVIRQNENGPQLFWAFDTSTTITMHDPHQIKNYKNLDLKFGTPKLRNPWCIQTPLGYSVLIVPPLHHPPIGIRVLEGIVDTDKYKAAINFPFIIDKDFEGTIPAGTCVAQVIPFKRDEFKMSIGGDKERNEAESIQLRTNVRFIGSYKNIFRTKKKYV